MFPQRTLANLSGAESHCQNRGSEGQKERRCLSDKTTPERRCRGTTLRAKQHAQWPARHPHRAKTCCPSVTELKEGGDPPSWEHQKRQHRPPRRTATGAHDQQPREKYGTGQTQNKRGTEKRRSPTPQAKGQAKRERRHGSN